MIERKFVIAADTGMPTIKMTDEEHLDFGIDWTDKLGPGETIVNSDWTVQAGLTKGSTAINGAKTAVWLSNGIAGTVYAVDNVMTTNERIFERGFNVQVVDRL